MPNSTNDSGLEILAGGDSNLLARVRQCFNAFFIQETVQQQNRLCWRLENFAFKFIFPSMLIFSVLGNILTILVYRSRFLKGAATVNLLSLKAAANFLGVCSLCLEMTRHFMIPNGPNFGDDLSQGEGQLSNVTEKIFDEKAKYQISNFEEMYWDWKPCMLFLTNFFGTLGVWCTFVITLETYLCISFPVQFRRWSTAKHIKILIAALLITGVLFHMALPITRTIQKVDSCLGTVVEYRMTIRDGRGFATYASIYYVGHALMVIVLPNLAMLILCFFIALEFKRRRSDLSSMFSRRRKCVLRLTVATTLCYLTLDTPNVFVFLTVALQGTIVENASDSLCLMNVFTSYLSISNETVPFLVYFCLNQTFRQLLRSSLARFFDKSSNAASTFITAINDDGAEYSMVRGGGRLSQQYSHASGGPTKRRPPATTTTVDSAGAKNGAPKFSTEEDIHFVIEHLGRSEISNTAEKFMCDDQLLVQ